MSTSALFSAPFILWVIASLILISIFYGAVHRRQAGLVETLREFVDRYQKRMRKASKEREASED